MERISIFSAFYRLKRTSYFDLVRITNLDPDRTHDKLKICISYAQSGAFCDSYVKRKGKKTFFRRGSARIPDNEASTSRQSCRFGERVCHTGSVGAKRVSDYGSACRTSSDYFLSVPVIRPRGRSRKLGSRTRSCGEGSGPLRSFEARSKSNASFFVQSKKSTTRLINRNEINLRAGSYLFYLSICKRPKPLSPRGADFRFALGVNFIRTTAKA